MRQITVMLHLQALRDRAAVEGAKVAPGTFAKIEIRPGDLAALEEATYLVAPHAPPPLPPTWEFTACGMHELAAYGRDGWEPWSEPFKVTLQGIDYERVYLKRRIPYDR